MPHLIKPQNICDVKKIYANRTLFLVSPLYNG